MISRLLLSISLATFSLFATDNPFIGTWKRNNDKSAETTTFVIKALGHERYTFGTGVNAYTITADGKPTPVPMGNEKLMATLTKENASTWKRTMAGYSISYHLRNNHTLEVLAYLGNGVSYRTEYERSENRSDLGGSWKQKGKSEQLSGAIDTITIKPASSDALSVAFSIMNAHYIMTLDGKPYNVEGDWPKEVKAAGHAKQIDGNTILETRFSNGKEYEKGEFKVSADGQTLTMTSESPNHRDMSVYDRQKP